MVIVTTEDDRAEKEDLFDTRLIECLRCGGVYRKIAPARYVRDGDERAKIVRTPCVECGTKDECIVLFLASVARTRERERERAFPFREGRVYVG